MLDTVLFDMGGTLEDISYDEATARKVTLRLMEMLRAKGLLLTGTPEAFWEKVDRGVKRYKAWILTASSAPVSWKCWMH